VAKKTSVDEINGALKAAANGELKGVLEYVDEELVSIDFLGDPHSCIVDSKMSLVINGTSIKVFGWYDNEWGYSNRMIDMCAYMLR